MSTKKATGKGGRKGSARPRPMPTAATLDNLAALISGILNDPATPRRVYVGLAEGVTELFNDLTGGSQCEITDSREYVAKVLELHAEEGGDRG